MVVCCVFCFAASWNTVRIFFLEHRNRMHSFWCEQRFRVRKKKVRKKNSCNDSNRQGPFVLLHITINLIFASYEAVTAIIPIFFFFFFFFFSFIYLFFPSSPSLQMWKRYRTVNFQFILFVDSFMLPDKSRAVRILASKPDKWCLIAGTYMFEGQNRLSKV